MRMNQYAQFSRFNRYGAAVTKSATASVNPGMVQAIKSDLSRQLLMPNGRIMMNRTADVVAGNGATDVTATIPVTPAGPDVTQSDQPAVDTSGWATGGTEEQGVTNLATGSAAATADTGSIWDTIKEWYWVPIAGATAVAIGAYFYSHRNKGKLAGYRRRRRNRR